MNKTDNQFFLIYSSAQGEIEIFNIKCDKKSFGKHLGKEI